MAKLDSKLEAAGAEYLVLGHLLIEGIAAYKAYDNNPGYDIVAVLPATNRSARIQVKSRWATDFDGGFLIKNHDCDFVALVALNRGFRYQKRKLSLPIDAGRAKPDIYIIPIEAAVAGVYEKSPWGKIFLKRITDSGSYRDNWGIVRDFLNHEPYVGPPRIVKANAVAYPSIEIQFNDGIVGRVDLGDLISTSPIFAPLKDPSYFAQVAVSEHGRSIGWNLAVLGREIDLGAGQIRARLQSIGEAHIAAEA